MTATLEGLTMCELMVSPCQLPLLMVARRMTKKFILLSAHPSPGLKRLVYEDEMRDYLVVMDMKSIIG